jgi:hypothetical protein
VAVNFRLVGRDDQAKAVVSALLGEFEANAGRCAVDDSERTRGRP